MLSTELVLASLARELDAPPSPPENDGARVFELDNGLRLGVLTLPDGSAHIVWSVASEARPGESTAEAEERAASFLRAHLARLRRVGPLVASRDDEGAGILYIRATPATESEWLRSVEELLNETEAMRNMLSGNNAHRSGGTMSSGSASLFAGMSELLKGRPR